MTSRIPMRKLPRLLILVFGIFFTPHSASLLADPFGFSVSIPIIEGSTKAVISTLTWVVEPDHFLYRDRFGIKMEGLDVRVSLPPAKEKSDPFDGSLVKVFPEGSHQAGLQIFPEPGAEKMSLRVEYQGCSTSTCFLPSRFLATLTVPVGFEADPQPATGVAAPSLLPVKSSSSSTEMTVSTPTGETDFSKVLKEQGLLWAMALAFLGGLLISLTPCVYPMIPITLSIIGGRRENTGAMRGFLLSVTYVAGLSLTYALLGLLVASFGAHIRGFVQGSFFQLIMSGLFALLALSMFDVFFLEIPGGLRTRLASLKTSGMLGVFLIGMISGLMASPCIAAPLAGILAFIASTGNHILGFLILLAFAWGMGIILIVVGTFSGSLNELPRAGDWMNRVKEFYGFLLLGAALFFAKPVLGPELTAMAVALLLAAVAAFLGVFPPVHEGDGLSARVMKCWGVLALVGAGAFVLSAMIQWGGVVLPTAEARMVAANRASKWHDKIEDGLKQAAAKNRPVFVDFRADWCSVCLELEEKVFPDPEILSLFEQMILVRIDATKNEGLVKELLQKYKIVGLPTLMILDPHGNEKLLLRTVGEIDAPSLARKLKAALK